MRAPAPLGWRGGNAPDHPHRPYWVIQISRHPAAEALARVISHPDLESPPDGRDGKPDEARKPAASSPSFFDTLKRWWEE